jgi:hypothetical protein
VTGLPDLRPAIALGAVADLHRLDAGLVRSRQAGDGRQPPASGQRTGAILVHELPTRAAGKLGYRHFTCHRAEVLVDTVTSVVCGQVGRDVEGESIPYVAGWGDAGALEAMQTSDAL